MALFALIAPDILPLVVFAGFGSGALADRIRLAGAKALSLPLEAGGLGVCFL